MSEGLVHSPKMMAAGMRKGLDRFKELLTWGWGRAGGTRGRTLRGFAEGARRFSWPAHQHAWPEDILCSTAGWAPGDHV